MSHERKMLTVEEAEKDKCKNGHYKCTASFTSVSVEIEHKFKPGDVIYHTSYSYKQLVVDSVGLRVYNGVHDLYYSPVYILQDISSGDIREYSVIGTDLHYELVEQDS